MKKRKSRIKKTNEHTLQGPGDAGYLTFQSPLRFVLPGFDPLQPGDLAL